MAGTLSTTVSQARTLLAASTKQLLTHQEPLKCEWEAKIESVHLRPDGLMLRYCRYAL
jgi:hypothetical protein